MEIKILHLFLILYCIGPSFSTIVGDVNQKRQNELAWHNWYRYKHGAPPLKLSEKLNQVAQAYAEYLASQHKLVHSTNQYGQNLYWSNPTPVGGRATEVWYREVNKYTWNGQFSMSTGHFTQLVWVGSKEVGFGYADGYVVANYNPAGNVIGRFNQNVLHEK